MKSAREIFEGMAKSVTKVIRLHPEARMPFLAHPGEDAGWDICSVENVILRAGTVTIVHTGLAIEPPLGTWYQIETRSSFAKQGIFVVGGIIDWGYRGEILVALANLNTRGVPLEKGTVIAQLVERCMPTVGMAEASSLNSSARKNAGFGSTDQGTPKFVRCEKVIVNFIGERFQCVQPAEHEGEHTYKGKL